VTGGEIFLRKDIGEFFEAVAATWKRLALLHFATNGFLTDHIVQTVRRIVAGTPAELIVTVSLDGDEELNDRIRGVAGGFRRQIETFNALRGVRGVRTVFGMTISSHNVGHFESTFLACQRQCPELRVEDFHLNVAQQSAHYYGNQNIDYLHAAKDDLLAEIRRYREMRGVAASPSHWVETRYLHHMEKFVLSGVTPMRCHALRSSCFIDPWGTVFPCITYARPLGSLRDTGMALDPIWRSRETSDLQGEIWDGRCPQCWTACEAYHSILGNLVRSRSRASPMTPAHRVLQ
jgi:radical SAM protein with 4Fe4S-binding SPASM domain